MSTDEATKENASQDLVKRLDNLDNGVKENKEEIMELKGTLTYPCKRCEKTSNPSESVRKIQTIIFGGIIVVAAVLVIAFYLHSRHAGNVNIILIHSSQGPLS